MNSMYQNGRIVSGTPLERLNAKLLAVSSQGDDFFFEHPAGDIRDCLVAIGKANYNAAAVNLYETVCSAPPNQMVVVQLSDLRSFIALLSQ